MRQREGAFSKYVDRHVELVGIASCGGCLGGNIEYAPGELAKNGAEVVHLATGMVVGYPPCPHLDSFRRFIPEKYSREVIVGTHPIPQKYFSTHANLGTWSDAGWDELLKPTRRRRADAPRLRLTLKETNMKICIPTDSDEGLGATVAPHLGRARFLTLVDTENEKTVVLPNITHGNRSCAPARALRGTDVQAVVCAGAGKRAVASLQAAGIRVLLTSAIRAKDALAAARQGGLPVLTAREACGGFRGGRGVDSGAGDAETRGRHRRRRRGA